MSRRLRAAVTLGLATAVVGSTAAGSATGGGPAGPLTRVAAPRAELAAARVIPVPGGGEIERFHQRVGGLPVLGAEAVVADPAAAAPILVSDHTVRGLTEPPPPRLGPGAAIDRARAATGASALRAPPRARLGVDPESGRAVWEVLVASGEPLADYAVLVDARDGEAFSIRNLLRRAGRGAVYLPNPVVQQGGYAGLRDARDRDSTLLTNLRVPAALERLTSARGCLSGVYVEARLGGGRKAKSVCRASADFSGTSRSRGPFEAVMAYFHIDRTRAYVDSLGLSKPLKRRPQRVDVNSFPDDNSYFSPITRRMALGTGGVDDGEDADVIVHEYGHSLQDQAVAFFGETYEGAAMGEGFGDYLAAAMSALATGGSARFDPCMFEWDATSYTTNRCLRRTDKPITKARAKARCAGGPHCVGEAWSGALWDLRSTLGPDPEGRSAADRIVLESHFLLGRRSNFRDGARALHAADALLYGGAYSAAISAEMIQRGFCRRPGC
jgi:hypothetical protein